MTQKGEPVVNVHDMVVVAPVDFSVDPVPRMEGLGGMPRFRFHLCVCPAPTVTMAVDRLAAIESMQNAPSSEVRVSAG
jgi:hypothetical protein